MCFACEPDCPDCTYVVWRAEEGGEILSKWVQKLCENCMAETDGQVKINEWEIMWDAVSQAKKEGKVKDGDFQWYAFLFNKGYDAPELSHKMRVPMQGIKKYCTTKKTWVDAEEECCVHGLPREVS